MILLKKTVAQTVLEVFACLTWHEEHLSQKGGTSRPLTSPLAHQHRQENESEGLKDFQVTIHWHHSTAPGPGSSGAHTHGQDVLSTSAQAAYSPAQQPQRPQALVIQELLHPFVISAALHSILSSLFLPLLHRGAQETPVLQTAAEYPYHHKIPYSLTQGRSPR